MTDAKSTADYLTAAVLGLQLLQAFGIFALIFKAGSVFQKIQDHDRRLVKVEGQIEDHQSAVTLAVMEDRIKHIEGSIKCPAAKAAHS